MNRRKVDSNLERQILTAMIMSKPFLAQVAPVFDIELVETDHYRLVAKWCLEHFDEYKDAPKDHIETKYHAWSETAERDDDQANAINDFLDFLSDQYDNDPGINIPYLVDETASYLLNRRLIKTKDQIEYHLSQGQTAEAETAVQKFRSVEIGHGAGIDIFNDREAWKRAFSEQQDPLILFPGRAGHFLNHALTRDALIGLQAPEKKGKTWWCVEFLMRALRARRKVALFEVGDMSESQIMLRLGVRLAHKPLRHKDCGVIKTPKRIKYTYRDDEVLYDVDYKYEKIDTPVSRRHCMRALKKFMRWASHKKGETNAMTSIHPNSTINVRGITGVLERWQVERNFIPDVIIIDYADILAPEDPSKQARDQINDTWKALRKLSQEKHCLVIAPTQADVQAHEARTQSIRNFSEDKRKYSHVTGMLGLNQTEEEKDLQIMRLNWLMLRESEFSVSNCLYLGQCFKLGQSFCCSAE